MTGTGQFCAEERDWNPSVKAGWFAMAEAAPRTRPPVLPAEEIAALPAAGRRRYDQARAIWHANLGPIRTPQIDAVFEALEEICGSNLQDGDKVRPAAVLDALPGLGKTTAALAFGRHTTMRSLNAMLCRFYGLPERGNADLLAHRAAECVTNCKTRLIIVDDVHFLDVTRRDGREVANHFKWLSNVFPVTFLFVGVGLRARGLLDEGLTGADAAYSQTARRWNVLTIDPFEIRTRAGQRAWRQLLLGIERDLVLAGSWRGMIARDLAEYVFTRSSGHFASLMSLVSRGCYRAVRTGAESLTAAVLDAVRIDQAAEDARGQLRAAIEAGVPPAPARAGATAAAGQESVA